MVQKITHELVGILLLVSPKEKREQQNCFRGSTQQAPGSQKKVFACLIILSRLFICAWYQDFPSSLWKGAAMSWRITWFWLCSSCSLHASRETGETFKNIQFRQEEKAAGSTRHQPCAHTLSLMELPCCYLASPALPVPGAPQDCVPVNWNAQWMAVVASPLVSFGTVICTSVDLLWFSFRQGTVCPYFESATD